MASNPFTRKPLNLPPVVSSNNESNAVDLSAALKSSIQRLYVEHINENGVNYEAMRSSESFEQYEHIARRLPTLDLMGALHSDEEKLAFWINLYNAGTLHGVISCGEAAASGLGRLVWCKRIIYDVGGMRFSLHDMEHGVLRGNRRVSVMPAPFGRRDSRRGACVQQVDARIHFVLNCAAKSCPPVLFVTTENVREVLAGALQAFLGDSDNLQVEEECVRLSMIFKWYGEDFCDGGGEQKLLEYVVDNGNPEQAEIMAIGEMLQRGGGELPKVAWLPYDWTLNDV